MIPPKRNEIVKLYEAPRGSWIKLESGPIVSGKTGRPHQVEFYFDHIDGMYSVCYLDPDDPSTMFHLFRGTDVEVVCHRQSEVFHEEETAQE